MIELNYNEKLKYGVKKYGINSSFMHGYNSLVATLASIDKIDAYFKNWNIPDYKYIYLDKSFNIQKQ